MGIAGNETGASEEEEDWAARRSAADDRGGDLEEAGVGEETGIRHEDAGTPGTVVGNEAGLAWLT